MSDNVSPDYSSRFYLNLCDDFTRRDQTLNLISQLNQLIKGVQKHRGITMAVLGGSGGFRTEFQQLQHQVDRRVATLQAFIAHSGNLISPREEEALQMDWQTIRQDWQDDKLSDNFELHSHFIEQLRNIVFRLARELGRPLAGTLPAEQEHQPSLDDPLAAYPQLFKQIELLNFAAKEVPEMIEYLAKVRGLSTFIAASGNVDYHNDRKLRFVLQCVKQQHEKLRHQAERLQDILGGSIVSLPDIKTAELKLIYLLEVVEKDVLGGGTIKTNSHQLFKIATTLIDVYWAVTNEGLSLLRQWHQDMLEDWLKEGGVEQNSANSLQSQA